ncbi:hypothetical protein FF1_016787 [Malus domestica]
MTGESVGPSSVMDSKRPCDVGDHQLAVSNLCGTILSVQKGKSEKSHRDTHSPLREGCATRDRCNCESRRSGILGKSGTKDFRGEL